MSRINRNSYDNRQWLGVAYAHIPKHDACLPFAKVRFWITKKLHRVGARCSKAKV